jgi:8-oxo-dGTP pyrophosphatase MutT (NUDIX family)
VAKNYDEPYLTGEDDNRRRGGDERTTMSPSSSQDRNPWTVVNKKVGFDCPYFSARSDLVSFDNSAPFPYRSIRVKKQGVCVAAIDAEGRITIVGQYRYVLDRYTWELPGGGYDVGTDELRAAQGELAEETGIIAGHWLKLIDAPLACGTSDEHVPGYVAWHIEFGLPKPDPTERLTLRRIPFAEAISMALGGELQHLAGIAVLLSLEARYRRNQLPEDLARLLGSNY